MWCPVVGRSLWRHLPVAFTTRAREGLHDERVIEMFRRRQHGLVDFGKGGSTIWMNTKS